MNLRQQAAADMRAILEDSAAGFATLATVTSPMGESITLSGIYRQIDKAIDPDTGQLISSTTASIVFSTVSLVASGMGEIQNVSDESSLPWVVQLTDMGGSVRTYKVSDVGNDELGASVCSLEVYAPI